MSQQPGELYRREFYLLVGPPKQERSKGRDQTKGDLSEFGQLAISFSEGEIGPFESWQTTDLVMVAR